MAYRASDLFKKVEEVAGHEEAIRFIINSRQRHWQTTEAPPSERSVFLEVCSKILVPLSQPDEVFLEMGYRGFIGGQTWNPGYRLYFLIQTAFRGAAVSICSAEMCPPWVKLCLAWLPRCTGTAHSTANSIPILLLLISILLLISNIMDMAY